MGMWYFIVMLSDVMNHMMFTMVWERTQYWIMDAFDVVLYESVSWETYAKLGMVVLLIIDDA